MTERIISCSCSSRTPDTSALRSIRRSSAWVISGLVEGSSLNSLSTREAIQVKKRPIG